jgi:ADP-ribose pyrophosphatase YjhB (NUDIX family)
MKLWARDDTSTARSGQGDRARPGRPDHAPALRRERRLLGHPRRLPRTGRDPPQAAARELREELGIADIALGLCLATRVQDHLVAGRAVRQAERYYLARVRAGTVVPVSATQTDNIREWRWWTLPEITATRQVIYPAGLTALLQAVIASGPPAVPLTLS